MRICVGVRGDLFEQVALGGVVMVAGGPGFKGEHFSQHPILCLQQIESGLRRYNFPIQSRHISPIMRYDRCRGFHGVVAFLGDNFWHCCRIRTELHDTSDFNKILDSLQQHTSKPLFLRRLRRACTFLHFQSSTSEH